MTIDNLYLEKELSWLSFNDRVLQEAADKSVPLLERIRFLGIYSNNIDEFYKIRVAKVKRQGLQSPRKNNNAKQLLNKIQQHVLHAQQTFDVIYHALLAEMALRGILLINEHPLTPHQQRWVKDYFVSSLLPHISPILLTPNIDLLCRLHDDDSYLVVTIEQNGHPHYVLLEISTAHLPRLVQIPAYADTKKHHFILIDTIIRDCIADIFNDIKETDQLNVYAIKITRDANYDLEQTHQHNLLDQLSHGLNQRLNAVPIRLLYQHNMPQPLLTLLCNQLTISPTDSAMAGGRYPHFNDFIHFPTVGNKYLHNAPLPTINSYHFDCTKSVFTAIKSQDILLYYPYHSFNHIDDFIRQAALDPMVCSLYINIYRVAKQSIIIDSLIIAAKQGKHVTVVVELQARFDEQANIGWAQQLITAGVTVLFGVAGVKIHSKLCLVTRQEQHELVRYAHIGTGNFNEQTAQTYTDFSLFTCHPEITHEVQQLFDYIANPQSEITFKYLIVSPTDARSRLYALIEREIKHAQQHRPAGIILKLNNLVDNGLIDQLYQASRHGVKIQLIIRGMCTLIAGIKGLSDNISAISIVDRFLEHSRVYIFTNNTDPAVFISSADWMYRNIDCRIEVGCPILSPPLKQRIIDIINLQLADNVKARILDQAMNNHYVRRSKRRKVRAQTAIYTYLKHTEDHYQQHAHREQKHHAKP